MASLSFVRTLRGGKSVIIQLKEILRWCSSFFTCLAHRWVIEGELWPFILSSRSNNLYCNLTSNFLFLFSSLPFYSSRLTQTTEWCYHVSTEIKSRLKYLCWCYDFVLLCADRLTWVSRDAGVWSASLGGFLRVD